VHYPMVFNDSILRIGCWVHNAHVVSYWRGDRRGRLLPSATSIISDYYPAQRRATALGVYSMGVTLGAVLVFLFGGPIAEIAGSSCGDWLNSVGVGSLFSMIDWDKVEGWRIAFVGVGMPGVLITLIIWRTVAEPPRGYSDDPDIIKVRNASIREALTELKGKPTFWWMALGAALAAVVGYGIFAFQIPFLVREHGLSIRVPRCTLVRL